MIGEKEVRENEGESSRERRGRDYALRGEGRERVHKQKRKREEGKDHAFICVVIVELKPSHVNKRFTK